MSSWQVLARELLIVCGRAAAEKLANEIGQKIAKKIETDPKVQKLQKQITDGQGFEAASNVLDLFKKKDNVKRVN